MGERVFTLKVSEGLLEDSRKAIARVNQAVFDELGINPGDAVSIAGNRRTYARLVPCLSTQCDPEHILLDGILRENAKIPLHGEITLTVADCKPATALALTPVDPETSLDSDQDIDFIRRHLLNLPVAIEDKVAISLFGSKEVGLRVSGTAPKGPVIISSRTEIQVQKPDVFERDLPKVTYEDIGGLADQVRLVREIVELPLKYPDVFMRLGIDPPKGILLYGPPGTGKTLIARAVAGESNVHFIHVNGPEVMHKYYGESEARLREVFEEAKRKAPSILFLDELDALAPKRSEAIGDVEKRLVGQLLALMDGLVSRGQVIVIGATNMPNLLDSALRRPGRFDREVLIPVPDKAGRHDIFHIHTRGMALAGDVDITALSGLTHGFVGADISALCREAGMLALRRITPKLATTPPHQLDDLLSGLNVEMSDFLAAAKEIQPTATREFYTELPDVGWDDIGGLHEVKSQLNEEVVWPLEFHDYYRSLGVTPVRGILFAGPSGTGKTLVAQALARQAAINFISVLGPSLFSKWFGESERALRELFLRAKQAAPCIVCIDEIDALAGGREGRGSVAERLVSQLLMELDGLDSHLKQVVVIGTTNRLDLIDQAFLRPGRFDLLIEFPLPTEDDRLEIFQIHLENKPIGADVNLHELAAQTDGLSGAEIQGICRRAASRAIAHCLGANLKGRTDDALRIHKQHFAQALEEVSHGVSHSSRALAPARGGEPIAWER